MTLSKKKTQKKTELKNKKTKMIALFAMMLILLTSIFAMSVITGNAKTYVTIRIDYCYINGSPAHDPYIATFPLGEAQDYEVTNPTVSGFEPMVLTDPANDPMELPDGGKGEEKTRVVYNPETDGEEVNYTVYYVAGMTHYAARYYLQNKYDDLYTLDRDRTNANQNRLGKTGSTPDDLEAEKIPGFTSLFHEPDAIAADGSTVFRVYYDRNYYAITYNLGEGGYGVDPIYAKYETSYRLEDPKRQGYTFLGWARTSGDSSEDASGAGNRGGRSSDDSWVYIQPDTFVNVTEEDDGEGNKVHVTHYYRNAAAFDAGIECTLADVTMTEEAATDPQNLVQFADRTDLTVPAYNSYWKAVWAKGDSKFSVVYWVEDEDSELADNYFEQLDVSSMTSAELRSIVTPHYTDVALFEATQIKEDENSPARNVQAGDHITYHTLIQNAKGDWFPLSDFFGFNLNQQEIRDGSPLTDSDGNPLDSSEDRIDFPNMSTAQRANFATELQRYYDPNRPVSLYQFHEDEENGYVEIAGDGSTIINIFYKRKTFNLQFFYAKTSGGTVTYDENDVPHWSKDINGKGDVYLTSGTKQFSDKTKKTNLYDQLNENSLFSKKGLVNAPPEIINHTEMITPKIYNKGSNDTNRFWYYEVQAKFGSSLAGKWFNDAFDTPLRNDRNGDDDQKIFFGSWAVEKGSDYWDDESDNNVGRGNYTIKGIYEKLFDEILLKDSHIQSKLDANPNFNYTELHFVASWDNTGSLDPNATGFNDGRKRVFNFTYKNCVELLPSEDYILSTPNGYSVLINGGTYPAGDHEELDEDGNTVTVHYISRTIESRYTDIIEMPVSETETKYFGLTRDNTIETYDAAQEYATNGTSKVSATTMGIQIRKFQTAASLTGYTSYAVDDSTIKTTFTVKSVENNEIVSQTINTCYGTGRNSDYGNGNAQAIFYNNGNGFDELHHADIYFFYSRNDYRLKYSNLSTIDKNNIFRAYYHAPMFLQKFQIEPEYPNPERRDFFNFEGWYSDPYFLKPVDFSQDRIPDDDVILYAKWVPKKINVVFYSNYEDYYIDRKGTHPEKRIVLGKDEDENNITTLSIDYGTYVPLMNIPVNNNDLDNPRPKLTPIAEEATFAGWYYISSRIPNRFEPENVPITALNEESTGDNATLRLFAEWVTTDVAKYRVRYVRADDPEVEIAQQTTGRAYVFKTKTFEAKSSAELYDDYKWTSEGQENGTNWWPTINSHSIVIRENNAQGGNEYTPNDYAFTYIQKDKVHYRVQYLDAATRQPINPGKEDVVKETSHASVVEDSLIIPGYIVETASQSLTLTASAKTDPDEQRAEELENNVITFLYRENNNEYLYQVDYLTQDISDNGNYSLYTSETLTVPIAAEGDTTVSISDLYTNPVVTDLLGHGYTLVTGGTKYTVTDEYGITDPELHPVAGDGRVTIIPTDKKTIKIYLNRKAYPYCYQYVDHTAESAYLKYLEEHKDDADLAEEIPWDGVIKTFSPESQGLVGQEITIDADYNCSREENGETLDYVRLTNPDGSLNDVKLTIQPDEDNAGLNTVKIYYRRDVERELNYQMVCVNSHIDTDYYNDAAHTPKFGRLTVSMQTVLDYDSISNVTFHDTNNEITGYTKDNKPIYLHMHRYTFLGWYTTPDYDPEHPEEGRLTQNETLTKENLGTDGKLPSKDTKYYALVEQDMVKLDIMFYYADDYTKESFSNASDEELAPIVQKAVDNADNPNTTEKVYPDSARIGQEPVFTSPSNYTNHAELAWHRVDGYSFSMQPIDNRVYKYEFVEWWQITPTRQFDEHGDPIIDPQTGEQVIRDELVRHYNWNSPSIEWSSDALQQQIPRNKDQYLIAVYARREVEELPYTINYVFKSRIGSNDEERTKVFVKNGVLSKEKDELTEGVEGANLTTDGDYRLTDEFILTNAPYESNYGETLLWSNRDGAIVSTSQKEGTILEDKTTVTADRAYATITAIQDTKVVYAHYRMNPDEGYTNDPIVCAYGDNHNLNPNMKTLNAPESYDGKAFSYWAVRKSGFDSAPVIAKSYDRLFDLCMMDSYWLTPVYEEVSEEPAEEGTSVTLTHLDYTRNRWTDGDGNIPESGETDLLFADFEIAFEDNGKDIYDNDSYKTGVILEYCAKVPDNVTFNPNKNYQQTTNYENLSKAVTEYLQNKPVTQYSYKEDKNRTIQFCEIPTASLTNHNRVEFGKCIKNAFTTTNTGTEDEPEYTNNYTNSIYLLKATAYLVDGDRNVTFSKEPVYVCYKGIASQNSALPGMTETADN